MTEPEPPTCVECGNDLATWGLWVCLECAEAMGYEADLFRREEQAWERDW